MKNSMVFIALLTALALTACATTKLSSEKYKPPSAGDVLPDIKLPVPKDGRLQEYLGVSGAGLFSVNQIKADIVIIKLFSVYCPLCHKDAPKMNQLYAKIESSAELKGRLKLIAIGAGNSIQQVAQFKEEYGLKFPVFADGDGSIHRQLGSVKFPYYMGVKLDGGHTARIFYARLGQIQDTDTVLQSILRTSEK
ncbi:MAG: TlpA disulfide reductase family protein [Desulfobacterales bacterium]